jgi:hypothetical protein
MSILSNGYQHVGGGNYFIALELSTSILAFDRNIEKRSGGIEHQLSIGGAV